MSLRVRTSRCRSIRIESVAGTATGATPTSRSGLAPRGASQSPAARGSALRVSGLQVAGRRSAAVAALPPWYARLSRGCCHAMARRAIAMAVQVSARTVARWPDRVLQLPDGGR